MLKLCIVAAVFDLLVDMVSHVLYYYIILVGTDVCCLGNSRVDQALGCHAAVVGSNPLGEKLSQHIKINDKMVIA